MKNSAKPDEIEVYDICLDASHHNGHTVTFWNFSKKIISQKVPNFFSLTILGILEHCFKNNWAKWHCIITNILDDIKWRVLKNRKDKIILSHRNEISKGAHSHMVKDFSVLSFSACSPFVGVPLWASVVKYIVRLVKMKNINTNVSP